MRGKTFWWRAVALSFGIALVAGTIGVAGASAASRASRSRAHAKTSTYKHLIFRKNGTPILTGLTFNLGNAAGSAHVGDTNVSEMVKYLQRWGANASQTNASHNETELAVAGGRLMSTSGPLPTELDAGLVAFGPNQVHLDDELLVRKSITSVKGLKGKTIAYCCSASPDGVMLSAVLKAGGLKQSQIHLLATGASSSSLDALVAGQVDGAFTAAAGLPGSVTSKFRSIATATSLLPNYADSFMAATPAFLSQRPAYAEAIDLAWLAAAKLFNTNKGAWVNQAATYTSHADAMGQYTLAWHQLIALNGWPVASTSFDTAQFLYNLKVSRQQGAITGAGNRPSKKEADYTPWIAAWAQFKAHEGAY